MILEDYLRPVTGSTRLLRLTKQYPIEWQHGGVQKRFWVPSGFEYDVASIPRVFWLLIAPRELGYKAPLAHDYLLSKQGYVSLETEGRKFRARITRKDADKLFAVLMREAGVPRWKRRLAYRAVRLWGWAKGG
tara:strand:+ start:800 stop:1198 length:399 start_codon:yes stop_codon:yes gene_type:complete